MLALSVVSTIDISNPSLHIILRQGYANHNQLCKHIFTFTYYSTDCCKLQRLMSNWSRRGLGCILFCILVSITVPSDYKITLLIKLSLYPADYIIYIGVFFFLVVKMYRAPLHKFNQLSFIVVSEKVTKKSKLADVQSKLKLLGNRNLSFTKTNKRKSLREVVTLYSQKIKINRLTYIRKKMEFLKFSISQSNYDKKI